MFNYDMEIRLKEFWSNLYVKVNPDKYDIRGIYKKKNSNRTRCSYTKR